MTEVNILKIISKQSINHIILYSRHFQQYTRINEPNFNEITANKKKITSMNVQTTVNIIFTDI